MNVVTIDKKNDKRNQHDNSVGEFAIDTLADVPMGPPIKSSPAVTKSDSCRGDQKSSTHHLNRSV